MTTWDYLWDELRGVFPLSLVHAAAMRMLTWRNKRKAWPRPVPRSELADGYAVAGEVWPAFIPRVPMDAEQVRRALHERDPREDERWTYMRREYVRTLPRERDAGTCFAKMAPLWCLYHDRSGRECEHAKTGVR